MQNPFLDARTIIHGMAAKNPFRTILIAPCGMNCAICMAFHRKRSGAAGVTHRIGSAAKTAPSLPVRRSGAGIIMPAAGSRAGG
jgi:hypothetical protein